MKRLFVAGFMVAASAGPAAAAGDAEKGQQLSEQHCARCHVVGDFNKYGGIDSTPSFQALARRDDWQERFGSFYERRPHPAFVRVEGVEAWTNQPAFVQEIEFTSADVDDILAFVEALKAAQ